MSERNGDRARFHKDRKRKLRRRQRLQQFVRALRARTPGSAGPRLGRPVQTAVAEAAQANARETPQRGIVPHEKETADSGAARKRGGLVNETGSNP